jgi:hypothetical protein
MDDDGLFREEALRRFREGGTQGQVLRLGSGWTTWAFVLLIAGLAVATLSLFLLRVPVAVHGPAAVVAGDRVLALLPAARRQEVVPEGSLSWKQAGLEVALQIERIEPRPVTRQEARTLAGGVFAGRPLPESSLLVWAIPARGVRLPEVSRRASGTVSLGEERTRLAELFWRGER